MSAFSDSDFIARAYSIYRPRYPTSFFQRLAKYHGGRNDLALDIGCGPGEAAYPLTKYFNQVLGVDVSEIMIHEANTLRTPELKKKVEFRVGTGENIPAESHSVDMLTAAEALHWFDIDKFFMEASRVLRTGGTLAFWGYTDLVLVDYPGASLILEKYLYSDPEYVGPYWEYPGVEMLRDNYRGVEIPNDHFGDEIRVEHQPGTINAEALVLKRKYKGTDELKEVIKTWGAYHLWRKMNPNEPDVVDQMFDELSKGFFWNDDTIINVEWASVYVFARKS